MSKLIPQILRFDSLPSTNSEVAKQALDGAAEGLCIVAAEQTAGRGRLDRQWVSPKDAGLYFSILLRPRFEQKNWPLINLMAAVVVQEALENACAITTDIKWPNDILFDDKKLCGTLAETIETPVGRAVVVGIGINLTNKSFPPELDQVATSIEAATGAKPNLEMVLDTLVRTLVTQYQVLQKPTGSDEIIAGWSARSSYAQNKLIQVTDSNESFTGTTRGLERDGALRVETDTGEMKIVRAADVTSVRPSNP